MEQGIGVPRKQMVKVRDGESPRDTAEKSSDAKGKRPIIQENQAHCL